MIQGERIERLETVLAHICSEIVQDAGEVAWQEKYKLLKSFVKMVERERDLRKQKRCD